jgi:hypothetical protein
MKPISAAAALSSSLSTPFAAVTYHSVPLSCATPPPPNAGPRTGVVGGVGCAVGFMTTTRGGKGGVVGEGLSIGTWNCPWSWTEGDGIWMCSATGEGNAVRISSDWAEVGN